MRKILSIGTLFLILMSLLVGCVNVPDAKTDNNSSAPVEQIDINDWYNADFLTDTEKEELFEKFRTNEISYHTNDLDHTEYSAYFKKEYSSVAHRAVGYMEKEDEWRKIYNQIIKDNLGEKGLNGYNMTEKEKEAAIQYFLTKAPEFYQIIEGLNISREELIKANERAKKELEQTKAQGYEVSPEEIAELTFTDEEIDLLYTTSKDKIREYFKGPHTIFHNNKVHTFYYFERTEPERWLEDGIPLDALKTWIKGIEEADIENYIRPKHFSDKEIQKRVLETYYMKQKIGKYEALLAAK